MVVYGLYVSLKLWTYQPPIRAYRALKEHWIKLVVPNRDKTKFLSHKRVFASLTHSPTNTGKVTVYTSEVQGDFKRFISIYKKTLLIN